MVVRDDMKCEDGVIIHVQAKASDIMRTYKTYPLSIKYNAGKLMYVCLHAHICIYTYIHMKIYLYQYTHMHTCIHVYIHTRTWIHTYIYIYLYIHIHTYRYTCICSYMNTIYIYTHVYIHIYEKIKVPGIIVIHKIM